MVTIASGRNPNNKFEDNFERLKNMHTEKA